MDKLGRHRIEYLRWSVTNVSRSCSLLNFCRFQLPYDAEYLIPELYSEALFVISKSGRVMNTNLELSTPYDYTSVRDEKQKVFKVFSFLQKNCEFALATGIPPNGTVIIIFTVNGKDLCFSVVGKNEEGKLVLLDDISIPDVDAEQLLDISCDASGHISILGM